MSSRIFAALLVAALCLPLSPAASAAEGTAGRDVILRDAAGATVVVVPVSWIEIAAGGSTYEVAVIVSGTRDKGTFRCEIVVDTPASAATLVSLIRSSPGTDIACQGTVVRSPDRVNATIRGRNFSIYNLM